MCNSNNSVWGNIVYAGDLLSEPIQCCINICMRLRVNCKLEWGPYCECRRIVVSSNSVWVQSCISRWLGVRRNLM